MQETGFTAITYDSPEFALYQGTHKLPTYLFEADRVKRDEYICIFVPSDYGWTADHVYFDYALQNLGLLANQNVQTYSI